MKTGIFYDVRQLNHVNLFDSRHPEHRDRVRQTFTRLLKEGLIEKTRRIYGTKSILLLASNEISVADALVRAHSATHIAAMQV